MNKKKIYLIILVSSLWSTSVTFNVDMSQQDVGNEGPSIWMGHLWPTAGMIMDNSDGDDIWSFTNIKKL